MYFLHYRVLFYFSYIGSTYYLLLRSCYLYKAGVETIKQPIYVEDVAKGAYQIVVKPNHEVAGKTYSFVG